MRIFTAKAFGALRVVYIAFAALLGIGFAIMSTMYLWEGVETAIDVAQCNAAVQPRSAPVVALDSEPELTTVTNCYWLHGPDPLSFESYGQKPVLAAIFLFMAFAALKRRWDMLWGPGWFLIASVAFGAVTGVLYDGWRTLLGLFSIPCAWLLVPIAGIIVAKSQATGRPIPTQAVLATLVTATYVSRAIAVAMSADAVRAIGPLLGGHTFDPEAIGLVSGSIVGLGAAGALLFAAVVSLWGSTRALSAAFAFTAGLSFPGFLQVFDLALGLEEGGYVVYAIQEAIAFVACVAALALARRQRIQAVAA